MRKKVWWLVGGVVLAAVATLFVFPRAEFVLGGALIDVGYRLQDRLTAYDFKHDELSAAEVWDEFQQQNSLAAGLRSHFRRTPRHPVVAMLVCMDGRIDTNEVAGDTRTDYYVVRTAGSIIEPEEADMLELAVANGVKLVVLTRHTDCAAEKAAANPESREKYPALVASVDHRADRLQAFLQRPLIAQRLASGDLVVKQLMLDTTNGRLSELP